MKGLRVQNVRLVAEEPQPGIVESRFRDAQSRIHTIIDKVPIFTDADLWSDSDYPPPGTVDCYVLERTAGPNGANLARIIIGGTTDGESEFVVNETDLSD
jgi:hypothetical protein